jgi:hypothetical protein
MVPGADHPGPTKSVAPKTSRALRSGPGFPQ